MSCPVSHEQTECPVSHNPATNMPISEHLQQPTSDTSTNLGIQREASSIPRTSPDESSSSWMYPSPRMFYNALKRKGYETDPKDVESMVAVHNFLNEQVWQEVLEWESLHKSYTNVDDYCFS